MRSILFDHIPDAGLSVHQDLNIEFISQLLSEPHRELAFIATQSTPKQCLTPLPKKRQIIGRGTYKNLKKYHERYLGIYHWKKKILEEAKQEKQVKTLIGRRRLVKDINSSNRMLAARAERIAVNTVIQVTAAMPLTLLAAEKNTGRPEISGPVIPATVNIHLLGDCFAIPIFAWP